MSRRKMTPELFDSMLASYEAWDPAVRTVDEWLADWPISRQAWYQAMRARGIVPKTARRGEAGVGHSEIGELISMLVEARLRVRVLEGEVEGLRRRVEACDRGADCPLARAS